ncbi:uncharacterized mitochondrial protein-like protein [Tanacetum coccineum]|uniref:Uncharacterized mitochondrial protein-like protein n=1 Tax=Tanacetum coccineum TaxID=301880 RepID=A0ABQ4WJD5_9ASTR
MILGSLKKFKKQIPEELKPRSKDTRRTSGNTTRNDPFPPFLIIEAQTQVVQLYSRGSSYPYQSVNVIESVLHSFIAESDPQQQITYENFDQIGKMDLEELDIKWQMAMLSGRLNAINVLNWVTLLENVQGNRWIQKQGLFQFETSRADKEKKPRLYNGDDLLGAEEDDADSATGDVAGDVADGVSNAAAEFALMDEVFISLAPSILTPPLKNVAEKPLPMICLQTVGMHAVPPPITGTFMPPSNNPDIDDTQFTYGSKSNNNFETNSVSNDFVSCDNSDKSSDSETTDFASCVSSVKSSSSKTNEPLASTPSSVDFKTMTETADQQPSSTKDNPSFSFKENVKPPRNLCNKSGVNSRSLCTKVNEASDMEMKFPGWSSFSEMEDIYHNPDIGIFSSSSYDDEFGGTVTNLAPKCRHEVYVDDIIFGSTNQAWCDEFEVLMKGEFEMSAMGELTFFLGLQVKQNPDGIFISQDKYVQDMLKKFDMENVRPLQTTLLKLQSQNPRMRTRWMLPDIQFAVSACSRHQVTPLTSNLNAVKKIFKYLKGQPKLGLWYPRDSPFVLEAYSDSDYAGSHGDRKNQQLVDVNFLGRR